MVAAPELTASRRLLCLELFMFPVEFFFVCKMMCDADSCAIVVREGI